MVRFHGRARVSGYCEMRGVLTCIRLHATDNIYGYPIYVGDNCNSHEGKVLPLGWSVNGLLDFCTWNICEIKPASPSSFVPYTNNQCKNEEFTVEHINALLTFAQSHKPVDDLTSLVGYSM